VQEFPQSPANLTAASQNLFDLIQGGNLVVYADAAMRLAISRTIALETPRGWRISKEKQSHKIDVVVALAMACHAAVEGQGKPYFNTNYSEWV
jgi:phage terminase large subunit-like protein